MEKSNSKIVIEDYKDSFVYKKNESNLNIQFNRVAFIFFVFFIIYLIYTIHLIHLGSRKSKIDIVDNISAVGDKLYRADIIDVNGNYLAKTVKSIDVSSAVFISWSYAIGRLQLELSPPQISHSSIIASPKHIPKQSLSILFPSHTPQLS